MRHIVYHMCHFVFWECCLSLQRSVTVLARTQMQHNLRVNHSLYWNTVGTSTVTLPASGMLAGSTRARPGPWVLSRAEREIVVWGRRLVGLKGSKMETSVLQLVRVPIRKWFCLLLAVFCFRHDMRFHVTSVHPSLLDIPDHHENQFMLFLLHLFYTVPVFFNLRNCQLIWTSLPLPATTTACFELCLCLLN